MACAPTIESFQKFSFQFADMPECEACIFHNQDKCRSVPYAWQPICTGALLVCSRSSLPAPARWQFFDGYASAVAMFPWKVFHVIIYELMLSALPFLKRA